MSEMGVDFARLRTAVDWSIRQLATPKRNRVEAVKQYVGSHYADNGAERHVPTNFLELAITIYTRLLAARAPRAIITTHASSLRPFARDMELAINQMPDEMDLASTLRRSVMEAMFSWATVKVGLASSGTVILGHDYGKPFADLISADDYFLDMSAKARNGVQFEGNDYWIPVEDARALWGKNDIEPDQHTIVGDQGQTRAESITANEGAELYADQVWCRDVWIPKNRKLVTYGVKSLKVFNIVDWDGPDHGPYHTLGFSDVPGNLLPLPPVALWRDLHELGNSLFRKLGRQADSKKSVAAFQGGNDDDVEALKKATDGEGIRYIGAKPEQITVGGIDAPTLAFYLQVRDLYSYFTGNIDSLGGLAPSTETVGQDRLLSDAANSRLQAMSEATIDFARNIFKALAWYEWTDPVRQRIIAKPVKGTDISIRRIWSDETRSGDFLDFNLDIDVFSMQDNSPSTQMQKVGAALTNYVFPVLPQVEAQGGQINMQKLVGIISKLSNVPELTEIVQFKEPSEDAQQPKGNPTPTTKPANTTRTYERVSRPGATRAGKDDVLSRVLMGGNVQPAEAAKMGRRPS
jgi:hypothetical protein